MMDLAPKTTFRGLPATTEQGAKVRHYIKVQTQRGVSWNTLATLERWSSAHLDTGPRISIEHTRG
jgi:hypothetical protein